MGKSLSLDLRRRIISKVEQGSSRNAVARQFSVARSTVINLWSQFSATGSIEPAKQGRPKGSRLDVVRDYLLMQVTEQSDITMPELSAKLMSDHGMKADPAVLSRYLIKQGMSFKKNTIRNRTKAR